VIELHTCSDATRNEADPECATDEEIERWVETKQV